MVCRDLRKVWTQVKPHRRQVLKCMDKKITKSLKLADFVKPPGYRRSQRKKKTRKKPLPPPPGAAAAEKLIVKLPFNQGRKKVTSFPVKKGPIKYAEDYQLQTDRTSRL